MLLFVNFSRYKQKQAGYILITTLIFLLILTLLILSAIENSVLESKMNQNNWSQFVAETAAESQLLVIELMLNGQTLAPPNLNATVNSEIKLQSQDACERSNYLIDVIATYQQAEYHLQSLFQVEPKILPPTCIDQPTVNHRIWWQQL